MPTAETRHGFGRLIIPAAPPFRDKLPGVPQQKAVEILNYRGHEYRISRWTSLRRVLGDLTCCLFILCGFLSLLFSVAAALSLSDDSPSFFLGRIFRSLGPKLLVLMALICVDVICVSAVVLHTKRRRREQWNQEIVLPAPEIWRRVFSWRRRDRSGTDDADP
jgi:hypothetical protein